MTYEVNIITASDTFWTDVTFIWKEHTNYLWGEVHCIILDIVKSLTFKWNVMTLILPWEATSYITEVMVIPDLLGVMWVLLKM